MNSVDTDKNFIENLSQAMNVLNDMNLSCETFCLAPYLDLDLDQNGKCMSCHHGKNAMGEWKGKMISNEFNNKNFQELRQQQADGMPHSNCAKCYEVESKQSRSLRQRWLSDTYRQYGKEGFRNLLQTLKQNMPFADTKNIQRAEVRALSLCNLRCMHCDARSSSQWMNWQTDPNIFDASKQSGIWLPKDSTHKNITKYFNHHNAPSKYPLETLDVLSHTKILQFSGGEPLLDPTHTDWLKYFIHQSKTSHSMSLDYNSNLNIDNLEEYFEYWQQFKHIQFRVSLDSPPSTYKYFRRNGNFEIVQKNINALKKQFESKIISGNLLGTITFNFFSALRWKEVTEWYCNNNIEFHSSLVVGGPVDASYLPDSMKQTAVNDMEWCIENISKNHSDYQYITQYLYHTQDCVNYIKNSNNVGDRLTKDCLTYFLMHDTHTDLNTKDFFPELEAMLENY